MAEKIHLTGPLISISYRPSKSAFFDRASTSKIADVRFDSCSEFKSEIRKQIFFFLKVWLIPLLDFYYLKNGKEIFISLKSNTKALLIKME